jgi:hypothetical protein
MKRAADGSIDYKDFQAFGNILASKLLDDQARLVLRLARNESSSDSTITADELREVSLETPNRIWGVWQWSMSTNLRKILPTHGDILASVDEL